MAGLALGVILVWVVLVGATRGVLSPEGQRNDGHIVDALGLHERLQDADIRRPPVLVRIDGVVETDNRFGARLAHLELHAEHGHARARHLRDVLYA